MNSYIVRNRQDKVRMASRSGGAFSALSDVILSKNGVIYGCEMNSNNVAVHSRAANAAGRNRFRGSKYVQSDMNGCMVKVNQDLLEDRYVLFTGTPCQISGLYAYLNAKKTDIQKLYTATILCHYVVSPRMLEEYILKCEKKWNGKVEKIDFRNKKKFGWDDHRETVTVRGHEHDSTEYTIIFYSGVATRESCFHCPYKSENLPGNIVLADAWGVEKADPDFNDNKGVSLVLINDGKGQELFDAARMELECRIVPFSNYSKQKTFHEAYPRPSVKDEFWKEFYQHSYQAAYDRYLKVPFNTRLIRKMKKLFGGK